MRVLRFLFLAALLCGLSWFQFLQPLTAKALLGRAGDLFDRRPARTVLILGNSRTYFHDMPEIIRAMADSAHDPRKLEITLDAPGGAGFEILWNDAHTHDLLQQRWDEVILQAESRAQLRADLERSFQTYGAKLIGAVHTSGSRPRLVVNWAYGPNFWDDGDPQGRGRAYLQARMQSSTAALGERVGAHLIDVGRLWSSVELSHPDIRLTQDGNHPSLAGSYLFALALYGDLSGRDVSVVTYVPAGLDPAVATKLRQAARDFQLFL